MPVTKPLKFRPQFVAVEAFVSDEQRCDPLRFEEFDDVSSLIGLSGNEFHMQSPVAQIGDDHQLAPLRNVRRIKQMKKNRTLGLPALAAAALLGCKQQPNRNNLSADGRVEVIDLNEVLQRDKDAAAAVEKWTHSGQNFVNPPSAPDPESPTKSVPVGASKKSKRAGAE
jgi:hypothetical protein